MIKNPFRHLVYDFKRDDSMGYRIFSNLNIPDDPRDNWGMDYVSPSWINDVHNTHVGDRCFIFGTGPSLIDQLPLLQDMDTSTLLPVTG